MKHRIAPLAVCVLCAALMGCQRGAALPLAPSSVPTTSGSSTFGPTAEPAGDMLSVGAAPLSIELTESNGSGFAGTCTLAAAHAGIRFKISGTGTPDEIISVHLVQAFGQMLRSTERTVVSSRGTFRTSPDVLPTFTTGDQVYCLVQSYPGQVELAKSATFSAP